MDRVRDRTVSRGVLSRRATARCLLAHFAKSHLWHASTLLFGFFLTEICALDTRAMGAIMAGSLMLNGLIDAALGAYWSRTVTTVGAATRRQARAAPVACLFFLSFCATPLLAPEQRLGWAMAMLLAFRACYPFIDVPQNAMVAWLVPGPDARCVLLAKRNVASGLAGLSVATVAAPLLIHGYGVAAWLSWAACLTLFVCGTAWSLGAQPEDDHRAPPDPVLERDARIAMPALLAILALMMILGTSFRALEPYYAAYSGTGGGLLTGGAVGGIFSPPIWALCHRRLGTVSVLAGGAVLLLSAAVALLVAPPMIAGAIAGLGFGAGMSGLWLILWSAMMTRAATGKATGHAGLFTCVSKLGQALAMLLLGETLSGSSYRVTMADPWSPPLLLMAGAVAIVALLCVAAIPVFRVSRTACDETPVPRHRGGRIAPAPDAPPSSRWPVPVARAGSASGFPASRSHRRSAGRARAAGGRPGSALRNPT
ncbi:Na+/melibiose symporter-like transporter [Sphingomonas sp. 1185]